MRVLIVSEVAAERQRAASALLLRAADATVVEATSTRQANVLVGAGDVDVLVVDGDLQPKGGFSWLYELREQAAMGGAPRPPAVVMTARPQDQFLGDWAGAESLVRKPVDPFVLADEVMRLAAAGTAEPAAV
jgi:DNA-binding response OmpR family regulator